MLRPESLATEASRSRRACRRSRITSRSLSCAFSPLVLNFRAGSSSSIRRGRCRRVGRSANGSTVRLCRRQDDYSVLAGMALAAQDKYALQVPGGLAFSEFRGYEDWQTVAVSQNGKLIETILGNPAMIGPTTRAFRATASRSPTAPRWRRSIGTRRRLTRSPVTRQCRTPCMTWTSWRRTARGSRTAVDGGMPSSSMTSLRCVQTRHHG